MEEPEPVVTSLEISEKAITLEEGESYQLSAEIYPEEVENIRIDWVCDDHGAVEVDSTGKVTGVGEGTAYVTVHEKNSGCSASCKVTVKPKKVVKPGITSPDDGDIVSYDEDIKIIWRSESNFGSHLISIKDMTDNDYLEERKEIRGTSYTIDKSNIEPGHEYKIAVATVDDDGNEAWCEKYVYFSVEYIPEPEPIGDIEILHPNNDIIEKKGFNVSWNEVEKADYYYIALYNYTTEEYEIYYTTTNSTSYYIDEVYLKNGNEYEVCVGAENEYGAVEACFYFAVEVNPGDKNKNTSNWKSPRGARENLMKLSKEYPQIFKYDLDIKDVLDNELNEALWDFAVKYEISDKYSSYDELYEFLNKAVIGELKMPWAGNKITRENLMKLKEMYPDIFNFRLAIDDTFDDDLNNCLLEFAYAYDIDYEKLEELEFYLQEATYGNIYAEIEYQIEAKLGNGNWTKSGIVIENGTSLRLAQYFNGKVYRYITSANFLLINNIDAIKITGNKVEVISNKQQVKGYLKAEYNGSTVDSNFSITVKEKVNNTNTSSGIVTNIDLEKLGLDDYNLEVKGSYNITDFKLVDKAYKYNGKNYYRYENNTTMSVSEVTIQPSQISIYLDENGNLITDGSIIMALERIHYVVTNEDQLIDSGDLGKDIAWDSFKITVADLAQQKVAADIAGFMTEYTYNLIMCTDAVSGLSTKIEKEIKDEVFKKIKDELVARYMIKVIKKTVGLREKLGFKTVKDFTIHVLTNPVEYTGMYRILDAYVKYDHALSVFETQDIYSYEVVNEIINYLDDAEKDFAVGYELLSNSSLKRQEIYGDFDLTEKDTWLEIANGCKRGVFNVGTAAKKINFIVWPIVGFDTAISVKNMLDDITIAEAKRTSYDNIIHLQAYDTWKLSKELQWD